MDNMPASTNGSSLKAQLLKELMPMNEMLMVFFTSTQTALWSESWWPLTTGQYAGTCIFLIALAIVSRGLITVRVRFAEILGWFTRHRETVILRTSGSEKVEVGVSERVVHDTRGPWRVKIALLRAVLDTVLVGVSYLLSVL